MNHGTQLRGELLTRLRARRSEIERSILVRVHSVGDPAEVADPTYLIGLREAVSAGVAYGLEGIEASEGNPAQIPVELFAQVRRASRSGIGLDTVLRRYFAGYALLGDFLLQEAKASERFALSELQNLARAQLAHFERLLEAIAAEYGSEAKSTAPSSQQRRAECVRGLLAGESIDASELAYELEGWHLGMVCSGASVERRLRELATELDRRLLVVPGGEGAIWAWLGGTRVIDPEWVERLLRGAWPPGTCIAFGEPARGLDGWRFTHREAVAAAPIAARSPQAVARYSEVALLAAALRDEVLRISLSERYLTPLAGARDGGQALTRTLRAYFAAGRNASSTAAALSVSRQTVNRHLRAAELSIGLSLDSCAAEVETALHLRDFDDRASFSIGQIGESAPPQRYT